MADLDILHEDGALLFVNKPAGVVVQRGYDPAEPVLFEEAAAYLRAKGEDAFLMQRLDRGTSGVIFFSKLAKVNSNLTRQFERKKIRKSYVAICEGCVGQEQTIDAPLARIGPISFGLRAHGKRAVTHVLPLEISGSSTLVAVDLRTGRTHQIRAHLAAIGHPLAGDWLYGTRNASRPMLHAISLEMIHPLEGTQLVVEAPPPADFLKEMEARSLFHRWTGPEASRTEDRTKPEEVSGSS